MDTISKNLDSTLIVDREQIPEIVRTISDQVTQCAHLAIEEYRTTDVNRNHSGKGPNYPFHIEESIADGVTTTYVMHERPGWEPSDGSPQYYEYMFIKEKDGKVTKIKLHGIEYLFDPDRNTIEISARFPYGENSHSELSVIIDPQYAVLRESDQHLFLKSIFYTPQIIDGKVVFVPIGGGAGLWEDEVTMSATDSDKILPVSSFHYRPNFDATWIYGTPTGIPNPDGKYGSLRVINTDPNRHMNGLPLEYIVDLITRNMMYRHYIVDSRPYQTLATRLSQLYESTSIEYRPYEINTHTGQHKVSLYKWGKPNHRNLRPRSYMHDRWIEDLIEGEVEQYDKKYTAIVETTIKDETTHKAYHVKVEKNTSIRRENEIYIVTRNVIIDGELFTTKINIQTFYDQPKYMDGLEIPEDAEILSCFEQGGKKGARIRFKISQEEASAMGIKESIQEAFKLKLEKP